MDKPSETKKFTWKELLGKFVFMWNDGIAFFAPTANHKLQRLLGKPPGVFDKLKNFRNVIMYLISFVILMVIVISQGS